MGLLQLTRYVDGTPTSQVTLGLALLTLSWDKNWDSHSLVNGYPSFYPRIALVAPSPGWSLSGTIRPPTMITLINIMVMNGWLTSFLFHVNRTFHSWDKAISDSDLETLPFHFTSIRPTIPEIQLFRNLTLKYPRSRSWVRQKGQGHILYPVSNRCTSFSFHINWTTIPEIWPKQFLTLKKHIRNFFKNCQNNNFRHHFFQDLVR